MQDAGPHISSRRVLGPRSLRLLLPLGAALAIMAGANLDGRGGLGVDDPVALPSGNSVTVLDVVTTEEGFAGLTYRFRFIAPWIAGTVEPEGVSGDMGYLCEAYALPRLPTMGPQPKQIIISLSEVAVDFGAISPEVVQFFEAYRPEGDSCVWEFY
jgi:hypothetical protein